MSQRIVVLYDGEDPDLLGVSRAIRAALGPDEQPPVEEEDVGPAIALPVSDAEALEAASVEDADIAVVLDAASEARAREAGVGRTVAVLPYLDGGDPEWEVHADVVLVSHAVTMPELLARGVERARIRDIGPIAPVGWAPVEDRAQLREQLGIRADVPVVVVRVQALELDDLAPSLVQLSLVSRDAIWLFDVGADPDAARILRRRVPGYGLDASMFADGPDSLGAYQVADVVLARLSGPEVLRALSVGASLAVPRPRSSQLALAHQVETAGLARIADAAATLAVTLDAALAPAAIERGRETIVALDAVGGAARAVASVQTLDEDERLSLAPPPGLPRGLERLSDPNDAIEQAAGPRDRDSPPRPSDDEIDKKVDEELAALREKLGL